MSDSTSRLPARPSLEHLSKLAKDLLKQYRAGDQPAHARFQTANPRDENREESSSEPTLADAQFVIAREHGFETWAKLKQHIETIRPSGLEKYEQLAKTLANAYSTGDSMAIRTLNWNQGSSFVWEHKPIDMQRHLPNWFASQSRTVDLALADAQSIVAHSYGFENWANFVASFHQAPADPRSAPIFLSGRPPFYKIDWSENRLTVQGTQSDKDWDEIFAVIKEHGITKLNASGINDAAMQRLTHLDNLSELDIGGSNALTDEGALHLSRMPQLRVLLMGGWTSPITDRGLSVLRHLRELRHFGVGWSQYITDAGLANLNQCDQLEDVNLMGTPTGDGAIRALTEKPKLHRFRTGANVTNSGLALLQQFPIFKSWHGGEIKYSLMSADASPSFLMLDGPFTDQGLAELKGLDGLFGLSFFWHCSAFTSAGLESLKHLANLGFLGCQGKNCDSQAMRHIADIPKLKMLMGQGAVANDDGFEALGHSQSIEYIWGRECPNFGSRGFTALASMPALRGIGLSCKNVDDAALSTLPHFPALRQLMPMDVSDNGFRHIGRCESLEELWCMYCQDTGDAATEHLAGLKKLKTYYAGHTRITDRSLEILSRIVSLQRIELWQCESVTDTGIAFLANLPDLREVSLDGLPGVSKNVLSMFPNHVRTNYTG